MSDVGLVLAAGRSRRFGSDDKLLADLAGRAVAAHVAEAMRALPLDRRIAVVGRDAVAALFDGFEIVRIDNRETGQSDSLRAGVAAADGAARLLVALGDMPFVGPAHLAAVLAACSDRASASHDGVRAMPPACFPTPVLPRLAALTGDRGAGALLADAAMVAVSPEVLMDIDTPDALAIARGR